MAIKVKFWGVRGSIACPSSKHIVYGGNTSCVEVHAGDERFILDSGTGIRLLGKSLLKEGLRRATLLMSHTHWDHINGFPFFVPAFVKGFDLRIMAGHLAAVGGVRSVFAKQMENPTFPVPLEIMAANMVFEDFATGDSLSGTGKARVVTAALNHPGGATGYRIEHGGKSVCYITDTEHVIGEPDESILGLIQGADLVIYDSTYTDDEFPAKLGWGHSTWQEGIRLCQTAEVKKLAIFHHDPDHEDAFMVRLEEKARATWSQAVVAREDMVLEL